MAIIAPLPSELGFNHDQFPLYRPYQYQTLEKIVNGQPGSTIIVSAPTGSGKSMLALGAARHWHLQGHVRTTILTHQKSLQLQYLGYELYPPVVQATGRANWPCIREDALDGTTAAQGICTEGEFCELSQEPDIEAGEDAVGPACPYYLQRWLAQRAPIRVLNYPYFFLQAQRGQFKSGALVCDEGHRLDKAILESEKVHFTLKQLKVLDRYQPLPKLRDGDILEDIRHPYYGWTALALDRVMSRLSELPRRHAERADLLNTKQTILQLRSLAERSVLSVVRDNGDVEPILSEQLAPRIFDNTLHSPSRLVIMSASIFNPQYYGRRLGLDPLSITYTEVPSSFPVDRRPVYVKPVVRMNKSTTKDDASLQLMSDAIDNIIKQYQGRKGLIHCGSYALGIELAKRSYFKHRMIVAEAKRSRLDEFIDSEDGVYVSPSAYEGLDLKDDLCRFNIIAKLSWPNRGDVVTAAQLERIPEYNIHETASALVQAVGRGMRHDGDWCHSVILDSSFWMLWGQARDQLPAWFKEALRLQ